MASYEDLEDLAQDETLRKRATFTVRVAATAIATEDEATPNHDLRVQWANRALAQPALHGQQLLGSILALNKGLSVEAIQGATDSQMQAQIDGMIDLVAVGSA